MHSTKSIEYSMAICEVRVIRRILPESAPLLIPFEEISNGLFSALILPSFTVCVIICFVHDNSQDSGNFFIEYSWMIFRNLDDSCSCCFLLILACCYIISVR